MAFGTQGQSLRPSSYSQAPKRPGSDQYGNPSGTMYAGGTPNFNERTGGYEAYRPGKAQPVQTPSQGTQYSPGYGGRMNGGGQNYTDDFRDSDKDGVDDRYQPSPGKKPVELPKATTVNYGDPRGGYATAAPQDRPPPFQMQAAQTPWGPSMDPFAERDAFISQLNQQRMQRQDQFNQFGMAQGSPWMNYGQAAQQAGLGNGSPSMAPNYGDGMIQRLNQTFGGPSQPPRGFDGIYAAGTDVSRLPVRDDMSPNPGYSPFVNSRGNAFQGSMSFEPGTSQQYQNQAYGNWANGQGYYQQPSGQSWSGFSGTPRAFQPYQPSPYQPSPASFANEGWNTGSKPYTPGYTWLGNQLWNMQAIEPTRAPAPGFWY